MKLVKLYDPIEKKPPKDWRKLPKLPNPFPTDIVKLVEIAAQYAGLATVVYKTIKLYFDYQNAKYIKINKGDVELTLPPNADRSLPSETDGQKTDKKKGTQK